MKTNPKCFNCDAESSKFLVWSNPIGARKLLLLYCNVCGTVQGVVLEKE